MSVGISLACLAAAVANEGAIGVIGTAGIGMEEEDWEKEFEESNIRALRKEIRKARQMTKGIIGVNIMVALTNFQDMVRVSIEEGIDIIFSGAGLPLSLPKIAGEKCRTKLAPIVSSGRAAGVICKAWHQRYKRIPDAVVVEGPLAGGHLGFTMEQLEEIDDYKLEKLVKDVMEALKPWEDTYKKKIPVIAAGGIYTGKDIVKFLRMGAAGVQMGTRFVATEECDASPAFKEYFVRAKKEDLMVIKSPVGMPGRAIKNDFLVKVHSGEKVPFSCSYHCLVTCNPRKSIYCIAKALINAKRGEFDYGFAFAGENAYRIERIMTVKELISDLVKEAEADA
jgi:NAD(P)H-dependent flavin oxidoreductase YrpB (nitropropane dioxygenase family)